MREREGFDAGRRGRGHTMTLRQQNKGRIGCENTEWGTGLGTQLRLSNKESRVCNKDVIDWPPSQPNKEGPIGCWVCWRESNQVATNKGPIGCWVSWREREARLQWMSALQRRQLAVETDEERRSITVCLRAVVTGVAVEQHSIQVKMKSFHVHFAHVNNNMKSCLRILDLCIILSICRLQCLFQFLGLRYFTPHRLSLFLLHSDSPL